MLSSKDNTHRATIHGAKGGGAEANAEGEQETAEEERRLPRAAPARDARTHPRAARPRLSPAFAIERKNANAASLNESILATGKLLTHAQPTTHSLQIKPRSFTAVARYNWLRPRPHSLASPSTPLSSVNSHSSNPLSPSPSLHACLSCRWLVLPPLISSPPATSPRHQLSRPSVICPSCSVPVRRRDSPPPHPLPPSRHSHHPTPHTTPTHHHPPTRHACARAPSSSRTLRLARARARARRANQSEATAGEDDKGEVRETDE